MASQDEKDNFALLLKRESDIRRDINKQRRFEVSELRKDVDKYKTLLADLLNIVETLRNSTAFEFIEQVNIKDEDSNKEEGVEDYFRKVGFWIG
jgi:hypothetical protein